MIFPELKEEARRFINESLRSHEEEILRGLRNDDLWECLAGPIEKTRQGFQERFSDMAESEREFLFENLLNDLLLAEKNFIPCPIW